MLAKGALAGIKVSFAIKGVMSLPVKVFRMPAAHRWWRELRRPAYENLQRRKSREGVRWRCGLQGLFRCARRLKSDAYGARTGAQLQRSGTAIAKWGK